MTLTDWASIGSIVGSATVLISLIYLALQVRQAEHNQQASIRQGRATRVVDIILAAGDPSYADALTKGVAGDADISAAEFAQFTSIYGAFLASAEDTFLQYREGLLSDATFASFRESWKRTLSQPGARALGAATPRFRRRIRGVHGRSHARSAASERARLPCDVESRGRERAAEATLARGMAVISHC